MEEKIYKEINYDILMETSENQDIILEKLQELFDVQYVSKSQREYTIILRKKQHEDKV
jgi:hypothetical protein